MLLTFHECMPVWPFLCPLFHADCYIFVLLLYFYHYCVVDMYIMSINKRPCKKFVENRHISTSYIFIDDIIMLFGVEFVKLSIFPEMLRGISILRLCLHARHMQQHNCSTIVRCYSLTGCILIPPRYGYIINRTIYF